MSGCEGEFRVLCDRCGVQFTARPAFGFESRSLPANSTTVATVEYCAFCVMQERAVSHRVLFLIQTVNELEQLKKQRGDVNG
jgi:late competence protein required for DNA uptake (superfamily II DNA/RNA helicase)